jgi:C4-dicarboxylate-specific signal transduction histidine kinase
VYEKASLAEIIGRVFELLSWRIENERISATLDVAEDTPDIWMNATAVQQLILNLTNNALDALKDSDKKELNVDVSRQGEFVRMTFADTGCGIEDGSLKSIFDPFFTTKPVGQGVGLGLSACQGIVKTHGGEITCESQPGAGMKFIILLPIERSKENE